MKFITILVLCLSLCCFEERKISAYRKCVVLRGPTSWTSGILMDLESKNRLNFSDSRAITGDTLTYCVQHIKDLINYTEIRFKEFSY